MKSTSRMLGGFKARDTRRRNQLRLKALDYFRRMAQVESWGLPAVILHPKDDWGHGECCVELSLDWGNGYVHRWFRNWAETTDYLIEIAPHC
ncbi:hypothetical protein ES705_37867 [subsurface metagenome]